MPALAVLLLARTGPARPSEHPSNFVLIGRARLRCAGCCLVVLLLAGPALAQMGPFQVDPVQIDFSAATNGALPPTQAVVIGTTQLPPMIDSALDAGTDGSPAPVWLAISPSVGTAPGRFILSVTRTDLAAGTYRARLRLRALGGIVPFALDSVAITLTLADRAPVLLVHPNRLRLRAPSAGPPAEGLVLLRNGGSGTLDCRGITTTSSDRWLTAMVTPDTGGICQLRARADPARLRLGPHLATIRVTTAIGNEEIPVTFLVTPAVAILFVNPNGFQFETRQNNGNALTRAFTILNAGGGSLSWAAEVVNASEADWLSLGAASGIATASSPDTLPIAVDPRGLDSGTYHALIRVTAADALNSPQLTAIVLRVFDAGTPPTGTPSPSGLVFNVAPGSGVSASQTVTLFVSTTAAVAYRAAAQTFNRTGWLAVQPQSGNTSTAAPARLAVAVNPGTLAPGVYRGEVSAMAAVTGMLQVRTVNVSMIIRPPGVTPSAPPGSAVRAATCTPSSLAATNTGLVSNFQTRAAWPTPLNVRLLDDCGEVVTNGQVVVSFSNGDPPLALEHLSGGNYAATWTPRSGLSARVTLTADAAAGALRATTELIGSVAANVAPVVQPNGVVSNFYPRTGAPLAPGMIAAIYGSNLAGGQMTVPPSGGTLPDSFNDVQVVIGGRRTPLYFLSPGQINFQVPFELTPGAEYPLVVRSGRAYSVSVPVPVAEQQPGIATLDGRAVLAQDESFQLVTRDHPARRGRFIVVYLVGMGLTDPPLASGAVTPGDPLPRASVRPEVTLGGVGCETIYAGLTPGFVGLYQINLRVPDSLAPGVHSLVVTLDGVASNSVTVAVE